MSNSRDNHDPRYQRVRASLIAALVKLAAGKRAEDISVKELTDEAGISRQAFYGHASSPADLLTDILVRDLRPNHEQLLALLEKNTEQDFSEVWRESFLSTLNHVWRFRAVYLVMVRSHSAVYNAVLASMDDTAHRFVQYIGEKLAGGPPDTLWLEMAARQQVNNLSSAIQAWASTGMREDAERVLETYLTLVPPWQLARQDESGRIVLHGVRSPRRIEDQQVSE